MRDEKNPMAGLLKRIDKFCKKHKMSASAFGSAACRNPSAVFRLRQGVYSSRSVGKIQEYLEAKK